MGFTRLRTDTVCFINALKGPCLNDTEATLHSLAPKPCASLPRAGGAKLALANDGARNDVSFIDVRSPQIITHACIRRLHARAFGDNWMCDATDIYADS